MNDAVTVMLWAMGGGFAGTWALIFYMINKTDRRFGSLEEKLTDIDRRVCRIEGALLNKECCMIKHNHDKVAS